MALFLYTYQDIAHVAFMLLNCNVVGGVSVLYIDGTIGCLRSWQYVVMGAVVIYIVPFFIVLLVAPKLLKERKISVAYFIFSCLLPLFIAPHMVWKYYIQAEQDTESFKSTKGRNMWFGNFKSDLPFMGQPQNKPQNRRNSLEVYADDKNHPYYSEQCELAARANIIPRPSLALSVKDSQQSLQTEKSAAHKEQIEEVKPDPVMHREEVAEDQMCCDKNSDSRKKIVSLLRGPYREDILGGLCYEGVINLRRLVLVVLFVFITDRLVKQIALSSACLLFLVAHFRLNPFKHSLANGLESTSLITLVVLSGANLVRAVCYYIGVTPSGHMYVVEVLIQWLEVMLFAILPLSIFALVFLVMCYRCGRRVLNKRGDGPDDNNWMGDPRTSISFISGNDNKSGGRANSMDKTSIPDIGVDFNHLRQHPYLGHTDNTPPARGINPLHMPVISPEYDNTPMRKWFPNYKRTSLGPRMASVSEDEKDETDMEISVISGTMASQNCTSIHRARIHEGPPDIANFIPSPDRRQDFRLEDRFYSV